MHMLIASTCVFLGIGLVGAKTASDNYAFMIVGGLSASTEQCLTVANGNVDMDGADVVLEACNSAIAAGDGRELWQHLPNGQISNVVGGKCIGADGNAVVLTSCDGASMWETQSNGQLKLGHEGEQCLSQKGLAAGAEDVAAHSAISASGSADVAAHGANMAVDGASSTFWASALDPEGPVSITVDLGGERKLSAAEIQWEFPAKAFSITTSTDGVKWSEVYATDSNVLSSSSVALGSVAASKVRIVMHEAAGTFQGHRVYGIKALVLRASRLQSIVEECAAAAKSSDARDKYFETHVSEFAPCSSKALRSELPSLEAARTSLASVVAELVGVLPKIGSCRKAADFISNGGVYTTHLKGTEAYMRPGGMTTQMAQNVESQSGINLDAALALIKEARRVILVARGALF